MTHYYSVRSTYYRFNATSQQRPTQPSALSGVESEYRLKCCDALESKGRCGSFHLRINVWVTGKSVWSLVNMCHTWAP